MRDLHLMTITIREIQGDHTSQVNLMQTYHAYGGWQIGELWLKIGKESHIWNT